VKRLAENPWCAEAASPIRIVATHKSWTIEAAKTGTTQIAQASIATLRAALTDQPRRSSHEESQPPPMLPTSVIK
jgi:hypothetical protein